MPVKNFKIGKINKKEIEVNFEGGEVTSDAGLLILKEIEEKKKFLEGISKAIGDYRDQHKVKHDVLSQLKQRVNAMIQGYEDNNDHIEMRHDKALQISCKKEGVIASSATLHRFEKAISLEDCKRIAIEIFKQILEQEDERPKEIILDYDSSDIELHGGQEGRHYHGYYDSYCYLPLYIYWGKRPLLCLLRESNIDGAKKAYGALKLVIKALREKWRGVDIIIRADSGFCRDVMIRNLVRKYDVKYIVGIPKNKVLSKLNEDIIKEAREEYKSSGEKQKMFNSFIYKAASWKEERKVIAKAEINEKGENQRYVITNIEGDAEHLYKNIYCQRGESENRVKEVQMQLFSSRASCHKMVQNQFRMLLSQMGVLIMEYFRSKFLHATKFAKSSFESIRCKLLKVGATITYNTRRYIFRLPSSHPYKNEISSIFEYLSSA